MLKVEFHETRHVWTLRMEGRLVGRFAEDARELVVRSKILAGLLVDLSEVTFVDAVGEEVLSWLGQIGGIFLAESAYSLDVCERLHLPVAQIHPGHSPHPM
jgi:uracil-DNA glycosylase